MAVSMSSYIHNHKFCISVNTNFMYRLCRWMMCI